MLMLGVVAVTVDVGVLVVPPRLLWVKVANYDQSTDDADDGVTCHPGI